MRIVLVQPICSVDVDEPASVLKHPVGGSAAEPVAANGAALTALAALIAKLSAALPTLLPEILQIIALFGNAQTAPPAST
jgi:hypothetical protein